MGLVYADIQLINTEDLALARMSFIDEQSVAKISVNMLVDSNVHMMAINETVQKKLQTPFLEKRKVRLADSSVVEYDVVGPIEVRYRNRMAICNAFVLPEDRESVLGRIPFAEMDLVIDNEYQQLTVNPIRPDKALIKLKTQH